MWLRSDFVFRAVQPVEVVDKLAPLTYSTTPVVVVVVVVVVIVVVVAEIISFL